VVKHTIFAVTLGLAIFFLYLLQYTGAFRKVTLGIDMRGPYTIVYREHTGAYHKITHVIEEVEAWARSQNLKCRLSFGEFFDNPQVVEEGRLRSRAGCLIDPLVPAEEEQLQRLSLPENFKKAELSKMRAVVALFSGAPGIGPLKVYPKAREFIEEQKLKHTGSVIEIYEVFDKETMNTTYLWPIAE
jgi:AraC family transcriptional regulator